MTLPRLTADHAIGPAAFTYAAPGPPSGPAPGVRPMATVSCLSGCVGPTAAAHCGSLCGSNVGCWQTCAGVTDTRCISTCFNTT
ncbi:hypothetical protein ACWGKW_25590 [Streptomyces sp. NPDC054766]|uniref:hypothetical protein n=1 Tax=Streptomyces rhizosphaerihabitans TaxID=1266770 RepID=UPI0021C1EDAC|nr:hypothetical protein [Streptomyces rhizosphaerihabitans]MCT9007666.1 hypothetical protein [Streptomyces rhizosphaerihabitans]